MPKTGRVIKTDKGHPITRNPARVVFAADQLRTMTYADARAAIVKRWGVSETTAERDIRAAKQLIASQLDAMEVRAAEVRRNERIADKAEKYAEEAAGDEDWLAVATLQKAAIAASREVSRLAGAHTPKKIEVEHSGTVGVAYQIDAILEILDEAGRAAFRLVQEQIEAAKADGRLALPAPPEESDDHDEDDEVQDADIVTGDSEAN
jgi:hypothetical protein